MMAELVARSRRSRSIPLDAVPHYVAPEPPTLFIVGRMVPGKHWHVRGIEMSEGAALLACWDTSDFIYPVPIKTASMAQAVELRQMLADLPKLTPEDPTAMAKRIYFPRR